MANKSKIVTMLEYIPLVVFMYLLSIVPYILTIYFAKAVGFLLYLLVPSLKKVALINLKQAFPKKSYKERKRIVLKSMQNMIVVFTEFIRTAHMSDKAILKRVTIENKYKDIFDNLLKKEKGIIAITGHIGNWEYLSYYFAIKGYDPYLIMRGLDNRVLNNKLEELRNKRGAVCVDRRGNLRLIFEALKNNSPVAFLCDQNYLEGVFVDFFGAKAKTAAGPVVIAMKTGSPIIIVYDKSDGKGHHKIIISDVLEIEKKDTKEETIIYNTERFTKCLEKIIKENPDIWLWVHPRWNTRPEGEAETFYANKNYKD